MKKQFSLVQLGFGLVSISLLLITVQSAYAIPTVTWDSPNHSINDGGVNSGVTPQFQVYDPLLDTNSISGETIQVLVNSTSYQTGITLTLTEIGDSGTFVNTNLIFTNGTGTFNIPSKQTIGVIDPLSVGTIISGPSTTKGIRVFSTTDSVTGIYMNLTETGPGTGMFENTLKFTNGVSVNGSAISVNGGDIVTIQDRDSTHNSDFTNELVLPNPDPALGALPAKFGDSVTAIYQGVKDTTILNSGTAPGGGGGGLIRPSLVLDVLAGIGGSPFVVSPPSFGGSFSDGLTLTEGSAKTIFDTSKFNQEIPIQVMKKGVPDTMNFKTYEAYNKDGVIGMTLYFIPRGKDFDMDVQNSIASIEWKNGKPVDVDDSSHILSNVKATSNDDGKFQHTQFSFTPTKSYGKMSFLVRAWNDHDYTRTMRVHDAADVVPPPKILPPGVVKYENFADLQDALYRDKYYKPEVLAHIHDTNAVFPDLQGKVYWLYDTNEHSVTLVISNNEDNELFAHKGLLQPYEIEKKGDYGFMKFTTVQLNRQNVDQIQKALESEDEKAKATLLEMKIIRTSKW